MSQKESLRGIILAGGTGSRFRPLTYTTAKQLLPIANRPVILYAIEALMQAGITDIGIVTGSTGAQFKAAFGDGDKLGVRLTYIPQSGPHGLAHAVQTAERFAGDDPFVVFLGDNFLRKGISEHVEAFRASSADAYLLLKRMPNPFDFGVAVLDELGRLVRLVEKPAEPPSDLAILGVYMFNRRFFDAAARIQPSARGELEITDAIQGMIDSGADVRAGIVEDTWIDTGGPQDLLEANRHVLDDVVACTDGAQIQASDLRNNVSAAPGVRIVNSTVEGPVILGRNAQVTGSRIGPGTSIGDDCRLDGVDIERSILLEGAVIECTGVGIRDSIIGRRVVVTGAGAATSEVRLLLGDESRVVLS
jgi:glucose-1-phosphate thymidylyltransferase